MLKFGVKQAKKKAMEKGEDYIKDAIKKKFQTMFPTFTKEIKDEIAASKKELNTLANYANPFEKSGSAASAATTPDAHSLVS